MKKYYAILIGCVALFVLSASIVVTASTIQASTNVTLQSVASLEKETLSFKCEITNFNNTNKKIKSYSDKQANNFFYDTNNNMVGFILKSPIKMSCSFNSPVSLFNKLALTLKGAAYVASLSLHSSIVYLGCSSRW